jgi:DNA polymerase-3 subunit epsilon
MTKYAVVDIETTGGYAAQHRIIEIAIVITDGEQELDRFESLVDPSQGIPGYIKGLTGITEDDLIGAPSFDKIAHIVFSKLQDCIFVAHNVNFDYSFVKHQLHECGYEINLRKLCTVRLSRKLFPGFKHYSLGNLCASLGVDITHRHRAMGDAFATYEVLKMLLAKDITLEKSEVNAMLKRNSREQTLPPNLPKEQFENLPEKPGVYYFHDEHGKIIYIGKAVNIRKRISSHFTGNIKSLQRQNFMREIHSISHELTGNELIALLLESNEIHHYWPKHNRAHKRVERNYGIFDYTGQDGYTRLVIEALRKHQWPVAKFDTISEANEEMMNIIRAHELCLAKCSIGTTGYITEQCQPGCSCEHGSRSYNKKVKEAIASLSSSKPNYAVIAKGREAEEVSFIVVKEGQYQGFGYMEKELFAIDRLEENFQPKKHYRFATSVIASFTERFSSKYKMIEL